MELAKAWEIANEVVERIQPYSYKVAIVGSIRRLKPQVRDIDLVVIPGIQGKLLSELMAMGRLKSGGSKIARLEYRGLPVDIYFATPETFWTLVLIRTGSEAHNIRLASLAQRKGWHLCVDGRGLLDGEGKKIAGDSEESFFEALSLPFLSPEDRE